MSFKTKLEAIYCSLPKQVIEALAPKSNIYQIEQGQKYSKTRFRNPETDVKVNYSEMLYLYRRYLIINSTMKSGSYGMSTSKNFDEFAESFVLKNNQP
jgi:hypothetical protein